MTKSGKTKVVIAGFCQSSRDWIPYEDESFDIWGLNRGVVFMRRATVWFDLHSPTIRGTPERRPGDHLKFLQTFPGPVYLHEVDPAIPNSVAYPLVEVARDIGQGLWRMNAECELTDASNQPYFDSSIAYELALAIHEQYEEIWLVGVDLNTESEYVWQRSGVSYLLGVAQGRGIKVVLPDNCPLLKGNLYGRGYLNPEGEQMSMEQLRSRFNAIRQQRDDLVAQLNHVQGAHDVFMNYVLPNMPHGLDRENADQHRLLQERQISQISQKLHQMDGQLAEVHYWISLTPDGQDPEDAVTIEEQRMFGFRQSAGEELSEGPEPDSLWEMVAMTPAEPEPEPVAV